jgi:vacuolar-type H+-ATPase subunit H
MAVAFHAVTSGSSNVERLKLDIEDIVEAYGHSDPTKAGFYIGSVISTLFGKPGENIFMEDLKKAEQLLNDAKNEAKKVVKKAYDEAKEVVHKAEEKVKEVADEAKDEAKNIVHDGEVEAQNKYNQLVRSGYHEASEEA